MTAGIAVAMAAAAGGAAAKAAKQEAVLCCHGFARPGFCFSGQGISAEAGQRAFKCEQRNAGSAEKYDC
jgi:hypothetical protein